MIRKLINNLKRHPWRWNLEAIARHLLNLRPTDHAEGESFTCQSCRQTMPRRGYGDNYPGLCDDCWERNAKLEGFLGELAKEPVLMVPQIWLFPKEPKDS